ncbi:MAG: methylmalonyl-CoA mutase family protein, partial [Deltaproteobacteria bacterium]
MEKKALYEAQDRAGKNLEAPGTYPFTRGVHPTMYTKKV